MIFVKWEFLNALIKHCKNLIECFFDMCYDLSILSALSWKVTLDFSNRSEKKLITNKKNSYEMQILFLFSVVGHKK